MSAPRPSRITPHVEWRAKTAVQAFVLVVFILFFGSMAVTGGPAVLQGFFEYVSQRVTSTRGGVPKFEITTATSLALALLGAVVGGFVGGKVVRGLEKVGLRWEKLDAGDKVTLFVGVFSGLFVSYLPIQLFQAFDIPTTYRVLLIVGTTLGLSSLAIYTLQSMADILPWNRGRGKGKRTGVKILDTNVVIDGRIYEVVKAGFLESRLYVARFVLEELQYIADSSDALRRQRGRNGLEVLQRLQDEFALEIGTLDRFAPDPNEEVDSRLVRLAKAIGADIVTNDFNLNRVATLQDVRVMSLNDLALALRTNVLPQEQLSVKVLREGNQPGQGVGYLDDGTMVVVEGGAPHVGETIPAIVAQVIQTERGKMIFAEAGDGEGRPDQPAPRRRAPGRRNAA